MECLFLEYNPISGHYDLFGEDNLEGEEKVLLVPDFGGDDRVPDVEPSSRPEDPVGLGERARSGVLGAILSTILISKIQGKVPWTYLITFPIFFVTLKLYLIKRREAKKEEKDQLSRKF